MTNRDLVCLVAAILVTGGSIQNEFYDEDKAADEAIDLVKAVDRKLCLKVEQITNPKEHR